MKVWTAEQIARYLPFGLVGFGLLSGGLGIFLVCYASEGGRPDVRDLAIVAVGVAFFIQAAGFSLYLRLRGRKGVYAVRTGCLLSLVPPLVLSAAAVIEFGERFASLALILLFPPLLTAVLTHALVTRRLECGDNSPLLRGVEEMSKVTWKEWLITFLICLVVSAVLHAFFGEGSTTHSEEAPVNVLSVREDAR